MKVKPIAAVKEFLAPYAAEAGVELVDAEWDLRTRALTVYIDTAEGLDLVTCEKFHRLIDGPLDELDPTFSEPYTLNCSSPGLDRPFRTERDFLRHLGEKVEVRLYAPFEGKKYYEGVLKAFEEGEVVLSAEEKELRIPFEKCAKVCLYIEV